MFSHARFDFVYSSCVLVSSVESLLMASCGIKSAERETWISPAIEIGVGKMPTTYHSQSPPLYPDLKGDQFTSGRRSIARRIFGTLARFFIAVLIGVGVTLAWQSHGDEAKEMVRTWAPSLGWLLPVSTPIDSQVSAAAAAPSAELLQQLKPMALDLAVLRRSVEQLAANQEQMAQNIATLQAVEQDISQKISSPPAPPRKPAQPTTQPSSVSPPPPRGPPLPLR
jgi:hypothetical protein